MHVPPPIRAPSRCTVVIVKDILRIADNLDMLDAQVFALLENPLMREYAGVEPHAIVVGLEVAGIFDQFVRKIRSERVFNARGKASGSAKILLAVAIDVNLQRA